MPRHLTPRFLRREAEQDIAKEFLIRVAGAFISTLELVIMAGVSKSS